MSEKQAKQTKPELTDAEKRALQDAKSLSAEKLAEQRNRYRSCRCDLRPGMTYAELRELGAGCTAGQWVCPCLAALRRTF